MTSTYYTVEVEGRVLMSRSDRYSPWVFPALNEARLAGQVLARWENKAYSIFIHEEKGEDLYATGR